MLSLDECSGLFFLKLKGALTGKPLVFRFRNWELDYLKFFDIFTSFLDGIFIGLRGLRVFRVIPRVSEQFFITDKVRFSFEGLYLQKIVKPKMKFDSFCTVSWWCSFFYNMLNVNLQTYFLEGTIIWDSFVGRFVDVFNMMVYKEVKNLFFFLNRIYSFDFLKFYAMDFRNFFLLQGGRKSIVFYQKFFFFDVNLREEAPNIYLMIRDKKRTGGIGIFYGGGDGIFDFKGLKKKQGLKRKSLFLFFKGKDFNILKVELSRTFFFFGEIFQKRKDFSSFLGSFLYFSAFFKKKYKSVFSFNFLRGDVSSIGALELGGFSSFVESMYKTKIESKLLYFYNVDEFFLNKEEKKKNMIVYQGHTLDKGAWNADIVYPIVTVVEGKNIFLTVEGFLKYKKELIFFGLEVVEDWVIFAGLSTFFVFEFFDAFVNFFQMFYRMGLYGFDFFLLEMCVSTFFSYYNKICYLSKEENFTVFNNCMDNVISRSSSSIVMADFLKKKKNFNF